MVSTFAVWWYQSLWASAYKVGRKSDRCFL